MWTSLCHTTLADAPLWSQVDEFYVVVAGVLEEEENCIFLGDLNAHLRHHHASPSSHVPSDKRNTGLTSLLLLDHWGLLEDKSDPAFFTYKGATRPDHMLVTMGIFAFYSQSSAIKKLNEEGKAMGFSYIANFFTEN